MTRILDSFGITYTVRGSKLTASCPALNHAGDRSSQAFNYDIDKNIWCCFSHHCQADTGGDIIGLIRAIKDYSFLDAVDWLEEFIKNNFSSDEKELSFTPKKKPDEINQKINDSRLKFLDKTKLDYFLDKGFSKQVLLKYQAGFWSRLGTFMHNRIVFPIRNEDGDLIGFTGRTIIPESDWPHYNIHAKWIHGNDYVQYKKNSFHGEQILFNFHNAKKFHKIILVEGVADGLRLSMAGLDNWVALLGTNLSVHQKTLLTQESINTLYLALDNDLAGQEASKKLKKSLGKYFNVQEITLPDDLDPGDMTINQIKDSFKVVIDDK